MKNHTLVILAVTLLSSAGLSAGNGGFGLDGFNRTVSASTCDSRVFSPFSYEIDCVLFSEASSALTRAKYAETMGILNGLENVYLPINEQLKRADGVTFYYARAFCLPDERRSDRSYRQWLQTTFSAEAFAMGHHNGADCWFRSRLDGKMEQFSVPDKAVSDSHYSYFDLVFFGCRWKNNFSRGKDMTFGCENGKAKVVAALSGVSKIDSWKRRTHVVYRIPLEGNVWFYAFLPNRGINVRDIRREISSEKFPVLISSISSITEMEIDHFVANVEIPSIDLTSECDLMPTFVSYKFPLSEMERLESTLVPRYIRQLVRFNISEGVTEQQAKGSRVVLFDHPFLFLVYHEPTGMIPVVGQYMGN